MVYLAVKQLFCFIRFLISGQIVLCLAIALELDALHTLDVFLISETRKVVIKFRELAGLGDAADGEAVLLCAPRIGPEQASPQRPGCRPAAENPINIDITCVEHARGKRALGFLYRNTRC